MTEQSDPSPPTGAAQRFGDLLDTVTPALQHHHLDVPAPGLGFHQVVDELLVVGRTGVDEYQLLLRGRAGPGLAQGEAGLGGYLLLMADGNTQRRGVDQGNDGGRRGMRIATEQPRLGEHARQVCREQQTRLELLHEGPANRRLR